MWVSSPCLGFGYRRRDGRVKAASERAEASRGIGGGEQPQRMHCQEGIIGEESVSAFARVADDRVETLQDMLEVDSVVLHSGTASARARSRISGRSASASTTSTRQPSRASRSATSPGSPARVGAEDPNTADPVLPRNPQDVVSSGL
jgi:hypothetical protein